MGGVNLDNMINPFICYFLAGKNYFLAGKNYPTKFSKIKMATDFLKV